MAKVELTETEKREILKCLEEGKPLSDKYRFLLFGDKREVELVWNGKTNQTCNVVLPFQVIEQVDEPRGEKKKSGEQQGMLFDLDGKIDIFKAKVFKDFKYPKPLYVLPGEIIEG